MSVIHDMTDTVANGIGQRLRKAREQAGWTLEDVSARLKMQAGVIDALEREDWAKLGAPVYVRGQLRSYAKLLGLPAEAIVESVAMPAAKPIELVPQTYTPRIQRVAEQTKMRLVYVVLTATIAIPVWWATRSHLPAETASLEVGPGDVAPADAAAQPSNAASPEPAATQPQPPVVASIASLPSAPAASPAGDLTINFAAESWVKLTSPDGTVVEQRLIQPGQQLSYSPGQIGKAVLGNATAVSANLHGQPVDLTPFIRADVVRFTVSSDGSLQPVDR